MPRIVLIFNHARIQPLRSGDVTVRGAEFTVEVAQDYLDAIQQSDVAAFESSLLQYIVARARGDVRLVGVPVFILRNFGHRAVYVRADSDLGSATELAGRRVVTNAWTATGNMWSRAALRDQGLRLDDVEWLVTPSAHQVDQASTLPSYVHFVREGEDCSAVLASGAADALICPAVPAALYDRPPRFRRLFPKFAQVEADYYARTGVFPGTHLLVMKRDAFERDQALITDLFDAFERSRQVWEERRLYLGDGGPWALKEEEVRLGDPAGSWWAGGVAPNLKMIEAATKEAFEQGHAAVPLAALELFPEFVAAAPNA